MSPRCSGGTARNLRQWCRSRTSQQTIFVPISCLATQRCRGLTSNSSNMGPVSDEPELDRLRNLVGPSERAYAELLADRDQAQQIARVAMAQAGKLNGRLTEMSVQLSRARQDQDALLLRARMTPWHRVVDRTKRRWSTSVISRVSRVVDRF